MAKSTFFKDFKAFISQGNIVDMATGVVVGTAFKAIVTSLVNDIIMPPIAAMLGDVKFSELKYVIKEAVVEGETVVSEAVTLNYGAFIQTVIDFILIALSIFVVLRVIMKSREKIESMKKKEAEVAAAAPAAVPEDIQLLREIRDALKEGKE